MNIEEELKLHSLGQTLLKQSLLGQPLAELFSVHLI